MDKFTMLYSDRLHIGLVELERILQACVLSADTVYLDARATPDPRLDEGTRTIIASRLLELQEVGAVKVWSIEGLNANRFDRESIGIMVDPVKHETIDFSVYQGMYDIVSRKALVDIGMIYRLSARPTTQQVQGVTEIIEARRHLWRVALAAQFGADRILIEDPSRLALQYHLSTLSRYANVEEPALRKFLRTLNVGPLSVLDIKDIVACRRHMPAFRNEVLRRTNAIALELEDEAQVTSLLAEQLLQDYAERIEKLVKIPSPWDLILGTSKVAFFQVLGFFSPLAVIGELADFLLDWGQRRSKSYPILLVVKLRKASRSLPKDSAISLSAARSLTEA